MRVQHGGQIAMTTIYAGLQCRVAQPHNKAGRGTFGTIIDAGTHWILVSFYPINKDVRFSKEQSFYTEWFLGNEIEGRHLRIQLV